MGNVNAEHHSRESHGDGNDADRARNPWVHVLGNGFICETDTRGYATPRNLDPRELVLDASEGFIPLWDVDTTLRWRFQERSFADTADPATAKARVEQLLGEALMAWGDALPVKFAQRDDAWDFEVVVQQQDQCSASGCFLARAFFPDAGRHELVLYPMLFNQSPREQVETLIHEIGHIFGLRHFFAQVREKRPSVVYGTHSRFSIMNYGADSRLTDADRDDLRQLYREVWSGRLTHVNGTPIRLVKPYHTLGENPALRVEEGCAEPQPRPRRPCADAASRPERDAGRRPAWL
jgi:Metallo-peptidase family M12B Reprolysin-like